MEILNEIAVRRVRPKRQWSMVDSEQVKSAENNSKEVKKWIHDNAKAIFFISIEYMQLEPLFHSNVLVKSTKRTFRSHYSGHL